MKPAEMVGKKFNRWTVERLDGRNVSGKARVWCRCDCGAERSIDAYTVSRGISKSCGCWNSEVTATRNRTHGLRDMREYHVWSSMIQRCTNPNCEGYENYGARGISVHPDWIGPGGFEQFINHIGPSPSDDLQIDRIDTYGNYEPGNVRWVTKKAQMRNKRDNRMVEFNGETKCLGEWAEVTGISRHCLLFRLDRYGWSVERALTTPSAAKRDT